MVELKLGGVEWSIPVLVMSRAADEAWVWCNGIGLHSGPYLQREPIILAVVVWEAGARGASVASAFEIDWNCVHYWGHRDG